MNPSGGKLSGTVCTIVGGGGFLGANLAMALRAEGTAVRAFGLILISEKSLAS